MIGFITWPDPKKVLSIQNRKFLNITHERNFNRLLLSINLGFLLKLNFWLRIHEFLFWRLAWNFRNKERFFLIGTNLRKEQGKVRYCSKEYVLVAQITYSQSMIDSSASKLNFLKSLTTIRKYFAKTIAKSSYEPKDIAIHFCWLLKRLIHS